MNTPSTSGPVLVAAPRPLSALVPLIQEQLQAVQTDFHGAETRSLARYRTIGALLTEAKGKMVHGQWTPWLKQHFKLTHRTANLYMSLADPENRNAFLFSSLREATKARPKPWRRPATREPGVTRAERARLRELACQLVESGFKALARVHHPDRGGVAADMARVNRARAALLKWAHAWSGQP
jgi:hypothetical protein